MADILSRFNGTILEITFNRPEHGNGATDEMAIEATRLIHEAPEGTRGIVLRGAGNDFCIGRAAKSRPGPGTVEALVMKRGFDAIFNCYAAIRDSPVPVIAVVQGRALGFGCAVAAVADITLASDQAQFQVPEMAHNIMPTMVMSAFIGRVPRKAFNYLVYSTVVFSAERALSYGIVSDVVPAGQLEQALEKTTAMIVSAPLPAVLGVKEYVRGAFDMPVAGAVDYARNLHAVINSSSEMKKKD
jgi:enoyl-CoA hydratase